MGIPDIRDTTVSIKIVEVQIRAQEEDVEYEIFSNYRNSNSINWCNINI